jgi:hypothetical protein
VPDIHAHAEHIANTLATGSSAPIRTSTPLTGDRRRNVAPAASRGGRRPRKQAPSTAPQIRRCRDCGKGLPDTARKLCATCWPIRRAKQVRNRAANGVAALAAARANGTDPTNTPEARIKRQRSLVGERAARDAWDRGHPEARADHEHYRHTIAPGLRNVPLRQISQATGVSISAASRIRNGTLTPHLRHWDALEHLAEN